MENASKALIIAGAILISILIISFGVIILGQGSDVVNNADMSDSEKVAFNSKFEVYEGDNVKGNKVIQMIKAIATSNRTEKDDNKKVWVIARDASLVDISKLGTSTYDQKIILKNTGDDGYLKGTDGVTASKAYVVKCVYDNNSGIIKAVSVLEKT